MAADISQKFISFLINFIILYMFYAACKIHSKLRLVFFHLDIIKFTRYIFIWTKLQS